MCLVRVCFFFFFFNDTATTEIYTLSLHDALPIYWLWGTPRHVGRPRGGSYSRGRSEEHTSELQSLAYLVCRLLLEKKQHTITYPHIRRILLYCPLFPTDCGTL